MCFDFTLFFFFKQKTAYEMRISDWSSDVCSSDLGPGRTWSVRNYKKTVPDMPNLPDSHKRAWVYLGMFPNTVIAFYPESMMFYQEFPVQPGLTLQRGASYRYRDETRQMRLARYLSTRIDRDTQKEDRKSTRLNSSH